MTYLSVPPSAIPGLPASVEVHAVDTLGSLIIVTNEPFDGTNPEHVNVADATRRTLEQGGLLEPVDYWTMATA
jgi:hypothetical protein